MNVLLVEDDADLAGVIARNLRARGHDVVHAARAEFAVLSMAERWPDALILDVDVADMTGRDVLGQLSAAHQQSLPAIVISAAPISPSRAEEFRPFRQLLKPFPIDALLRALKEFDAIPLSAERVP